MTALAGGCGTLRDGGGDSTPIGISRATGQLGTLRAPAYRARTPAIPIPVEAASARRRLRSLTGSVCTHGSDVGGVEGREAARRPRIRPVRLVATVVLFALATSGCMNGGILRAAAPTSLPTATPSPAASPLEDPQPLAFPRDEGPHDRLTEWWYYTGHLHAEDGRDFGFEFVTFRAERGSFPVAWASHFAITDRTAGTFTYEQRVEYGAQVDRSPPDAGFDFAIRPAFVDAGVVPEPWAMRGVGGRDHVTAAMVGNAIDLELTTDRPPVLHDDDGWVDLGPAGGTYYYSRTRMEVEGTLTSSGTSGGQPVHVTGQAWFDHQWGDFIAVGAGGWDWFSVQLADGRDLTISSVHGPGGVEFFRYGTLVAADGSARNLSADAFGIEVLDRWQSLRSGADYPAEWRITIPGEGLSLHLVPVLADQELDTTGSSGVIYWEGEVTVDGMDDGKPVEGLGYVELTGYASP